MQIFLNVYKKDIPRFLFQCLLNCEIPPKNQISYAGSRTVLRTFSSLAISCCSRACLSKTGRPFFSFVKTKKIKNKIDNLTCLN